MKKFLCVLLSLFTLMLTGCGAAEKESEDTAVNTEVYSGTGYTLSYDPDKWEVSVDNDDGNDRVTFVRKDYDDVKFTVERKFDNDSGTLNEYLEHCKNMGELDGITYNSGETVSINGWNWGRAELQQSYSAHMINFVWLYTNKSSYSYNVDFSAENPGYYDCLPEFEEILNSFEFT